ncbi:DUF7453 family protein [Lacipirellula sp.]|uniref:DUF7453 family protein n=1 Tax=Lacipirellula sp. TaxID=2691419 RepID=UPI003D0B8D38
MLKRTTGLLQPLLAILTCATVASPAVAANVRVVALSGQHSPGMDAGDAFLAFLYPPSVNNSGLTAFHALAGNSAPNRTAQGVWSEGRGFLELAALEDRQAPGAPTGANFVSLSSPVLNDAGKSAFAGQTSISNGPSYSGLFTNEAGVTQAVMLDGAAAPGASSGVQFRGIIDGIALLNKAGDTASKFFVQGDDVTSQNDIGIWAHSAGSLKLIARTGNQAAGVPAGVPYSYLFDWPALNDQGELAFAGAVVSPIGGLGADSGVWAGAPNNMRLVARHGESAPGLPAGVTLDSLFGAVINGGGKTAFAASVVGAGVTASNRYGIWAEDSSGLKLVARTGDAAPGAADGALFNSIQRPVINDAGKVAFVAGLSVTSPNVISSGGLWAGTPGNVELVVRSGSQAPGTPTGAEFDAFTAPAMNARGQVAFEARLLTPRPIGRDGPIVGNPAGGVNSMNDNGLWATDMQGNLRLIVREGDLFEVGPNDFRTVGSIEFNGSTGNGDGRASGLNESGQIAFALTFRGGSGGVFVSNLVAVPEPATIAHGSVALVALLRARRMRR